MQNARFKPMHVIEAKLCRQCSKCHSEIFSDKKVIAIFGVIGQNFGPVYFSLQGQWIAPSLKIGQVHLSFKERLVFFSLSSHFIRNSWVQIV